MLRHMESQPNLRQAFGEAESQAQKNSSDSSAGAFVESFARAEDWIDKTPLRTLFPDTAAFPESHFQAPSLDQFIGQPIESSQLQSSNSNQSAKPCLEVLVRTAKHRLEASPWLNGIGSEQYILFVNYCLADAVFWIESRLVFAKYTTVPRDAFKRLFDDPEESLAGYGFMTEDRNKDITSRGFFDILVNYRKQAIGRPPRPLAANVLRYKDPNAQYAEVAASQEDKKKNKRSWGKKTWERLSWGKKSGEKMKKQAQNLPAECDRIGNLLTSAGYLPDPTDPYKVEDLFHGDYPEPLQYHADVKTFLELILCLLLATCPHILDVEDILNLSFTNGDGGAYRTLRYENNHLVILSFDPESDRIFRTIVPDPLARLILIYLIDVRPMVILLNEWNNLEGRHWRQDVLFPDKAGGCWSRERMNQVIVENTNHRMGVIGGIDIEEFRAVYFNQREELGDGWLYENVFRVEENGKLVMKAEMGWSQLPPEGENHPGGERYLIKHFESSNISPSKLIPETTSKPQEKRWIEI